jgi:hypothetical protein
MSGLATKEILKFVRANSVSLKSIKKNKSAVRLSLFENYCSQSKKFIDTLSIIIMNLKSFKTSFKVKHPTPELLFFLSESFFRPGQ